MNIPRPEHPNPQFLRESWQNLNGEWHFETDLSNSGIERGIMKTDFLQKRITVPFCPECKLSGIGFTDFMPSVWYKRKVNISEEQLLGRVFLHFGACDYFTTVWINSNKVGTHKGGFSSFKFEITDFLKSGENVITVNAQDNTKDVLQPTGKQSPEWRQHNCVYSRTTGIWQTVWLEFTPKEYIKNIKFYPNAMDGIVGVKADLNGCAELRAEVFYEGKKMGEYISENAEGTNVFSINLKEKYLWELGNGRLYDVVLTFGNDRVNTYFGLRDIAYKNGKFYLNGKPVFQRLVLDQGFYPEGTYTAPDDAALINDIELSLKAGFNGARLHQKIFEPRFLYHCDRLGYMTWGEYPNWGLDHSNPLAIYSILPEWCEEVERDFNHPSLVCWCPMNETWDFGENCKRQDNDYIRAIYEITKLLDTTRPCIDTSGNYHVVTDIFDVHDYEQKLDVFKARYDRLFTENVLEDKFSDRQPYNGEIVMLSEYGGMRIDKSDEDANQNPDTWGYGVAKSEKEFIYRYDGLTSAILDNPKMAGFCYTQLYDVEQEINGLYTYDRVPKVDISKIYDINTKKAAMEE